MSLVRVASPESEPDVALITSALQAADIPHFVHGGGIGGLLPGLQIGGYNTKSVMVPASCAEFACEVIASLHLSTTAVRTAQARGGKLRLALETLLFGWFVPSRQAPPPERES
jgi:hypothetical protein